MPSLYKLFGVSNPSVKKLLLWRQGDEDERWAEKAIESLIKKLKSKSNSVDLLDNVLATQNPASPCITIPRSLDGRLQVLHRKGLPHVIYCRIFRWPDLQSQHEIKSVEHCRAPFSKSLPDVCINPFHYERVEASVPPPVLVPREPEFFVKNMPHINQRIQQPGMDQQMDPRISVVQMQQGSFGMSENMQKSAFTPVPFLVDKNWCAISYFELSSQVGEAYRPSTDCVIIDGYANPLTANGRISLGALSNVRRTPESDAVLGHIGAGIQLFNHLGDVYLENVSPSSVFIQSSNLNFIRNFNPKAVVRVSAGSFYS
ncbi:Mothers against decapentaplegic 9 [Thelohanellus kitauei]|uniref:Mothers against decapentaplegic homolog n=1 Tax=Thelohanellus kitauei TaxID=669202 RepID=A0A0C2MQ86_THEKT|nr:Mothers against decapentaplegic 9 [Thelohanellus kitauei]